MAVSCPQIIRTSAARHADAVALSEIACPPHGAIEPGREVTYRQLYRTVLRCCKGLGNLGCRPGDRLAVLLDNSIDMVVTEWACLMAGYVWVALNARASAEELSAILADSRPSVLVVGGRLRSLAGTLGVPPGCRLLEAGTSWQAMLASAAELEVPAEPAAEAPVRIRYTSGTAGQPKGAVLPRRSYDASVETVTAVLAPISADDVVVQVAPMTHASGAMLLPHLAAGARALLLDRFDAPTLLGVIERYRATAVFLVPTMLVRLLDVLDDPARVASLRTIVYGGASMPIEPLVTGIERLGPIFVQIYGLTESTWPVAALGKDDHLRRAGESEAAWRARLASCGRPTSVGEVRVVDAGGDEAAAGEIGELWVRGRNTMLGYWPLAGGGPAPDPKGLDAEGWMHTGDVGFRDADGYLTIVDRLHDMIVSGGFNVYPREVEDALCSHPAVLEAAVVGLPSREWGETVHAAVVLRPGSRATPAELVEHCAQHVAGYKKPRTLEILVSLPRNASGKILRRELRLRRRAGEPPKI